MVTEGRTKKALTNSIFGFLSYVIMIFLTFFLQRVFVKILGYDILGLNSLFNTIIATLSVAELGIATAISFSLYKPIAENDEKKIAAIISLFKRIYQIIGMVIIVIGCAIIPLLPILTKHQFTLTYMLPAYSFFLLNVLVSYLFTYNHTLVIADQKNYINSLVTLIAKGVTVGLQIAVLYIWGNFYIFLAVMLIANAVSNIFLSLYVSKKYAYIKKYKNEKLDKEDKNGLKTNIFALVYHRVGNYLVTGTDNLIISGFLGVTIIGYYTNYITVISAMAALIGSIFAGIVAGFGNLIVTSDKIHVKRIFRRTQFVNYLIYVVALAGFFTLANQFMSLWLTSETVLSTGVLVFICFNFYVTGYSRTLGELRAAAGVFKPDRYLHVLIAVLNLIISIILVNYIGLMGVLLGTSICLIIKECIVLPILGSKYIYGGKPKEYYLKLILELILAAGITALCWFINRYITTGNSIIDFVLGGILCIAAPTLIICAIYFKTDEFTYLVALAKGFTGKLLKKKKSSQKEKIDEDNTDGT